MHPYSDSNLARSQAHQINLLKLQPSECSFIRNEAIFLGTCSSLYVYKLIQNLNSFSELNCQPPTQADTLALTV